MSCVAAEPLCWEIVEATESIPGKAVSAQTGLLRTVEDCTAAVDERSCRMMAGKCRSRMVAQAAKQSK